MHAFVHKHEQMNCDQPTMLLLLCSPHPFTQTETKSQDDSNFADLVQEIKLSNGKSLVFVPTVLQEPG